jgi:hypothetical protein
MGAFYTNYTLRGVSQRAVAKALAGREALISREQNGCVVVFDKLSDAQDQAQIASLASDLSKSLNCAVLALLDHDDDILWYRLYEAGKLSDEYDSTPNYWGTKGPDTLPPSGGGAARLCAAFQAGDAAVVETILRSSSIAKNEYVFAMDRHKDLVTALSLPEFAVGGAYGGIVRGYFPQGLSKQDLMSPA